MEEVTIQASTKIFTGFSLENDLRKEFNRLYTLAIKQERYRNDKADAINTCVENTIYNILRLRGIISQDESLNNILSKIEKNDQSFDQNIRSSILNLLKKVNQKNKKVLKNIENQQIAITIYNGEITMVIHANKKNKAVVVNSTESSNSANDGSFPLNHEAASETTELPQTTMQSKKLRDLRLKFILNNFLISTALFIVVGGLTLSNNLTGIFDKLPNKFVWNILGHNVTVPSMSNTIFLTTFIYIAVAVAGVFIYNEYFKFKYKIDKLEGKTNEKKKVQLQYFIALVFFAAFHDICTTIFDEINNALENSLSGTSLKSSYLWVVYGMIFASLIVLNFVEIWKVELMNKAQFKSKNEIESDKSEGNLFKRGLKRLWSIETAKELAVLSGLALVIVASSFGISKIPAQFIQFHFAPTINGATIELLSNRNNLYLLIFIQVTLLALCYKFIIEPWKDGTLINKNRNFEQKLAEFFKTIAVGLTFGLCKSISNQERKDKMKEFFHTVLMGFAIAACMTISTCAINSFHNIGNQQSFLILLPLVILCISSFLLALFTVKQYEKDTMSTKIDLDIQEVTHMNSIYSDKDFVF